MKQLKADITALRVDFDVDVFKVDSGVYVLAQDRPHQRGFLNFVSPAYSTKSALLEYCKTNFDDVMRSLYPDYPVDQPGEEKPYDLSQFRPLETIMFGQLPGVRVTHESLARFKVMEGIEAPSSGALAFMASIEAQTNKPE